MTSSILFVHNISKRTKKNSIIFCLLLPIALLGGCAAQVQQVVEREPLEEIKPNIPEKPADGSLWVSNAASLFNDQTAHSIGDIVTVIISEQASASKQAMTNTGRNSDMSAAIPTFFGFEASKYFSEQRNPITPSNLLKAQFTNKFSGNGSTSRTENLTASLTTQVIDTYPNGQLKIRGGKEVMVNNEVQIIYLTGIIRPQDITVNNTINSSQILNARISYTGKGAISDKQKPGWAMRILDNIWPF